MLIWLEANGLLKMDFWVRWMKSRSENEGSCSWKVPEEIVIEAIDLERTPETCLVSAAGDTKGIFHLNNELSALRRGDLIIEEVVATTSLNRPGASGLHW